MNFGILQVCSKEGQCEHQTISSCCQKVEQFSLSCPFSGDTELHLFPQIESYLEQIFWPFSAPQVAVLSIDNCSTVSTKDHCLGCFPY